MRKISFINLKRRINASVVAVLFGATQVIFPMLASGTAYAASADIDQWANLDSSWVNGNLNETKATLTEGSSVPFRSSLTGLSNGSHTLRIAYDNVDNNKHAYDFITSFDRTFAPDPCSGVLATCLPGTTGNIPTDPTLANAPGPVSQVPGQIKIFGANGTSTAITNVVYAATPGHVLSGGSKTTVVDITFTTNTPNVVLAWGGHIAKESDWGVGNGASAISGSPYHMRLQALDGASTGNQDRSMKAGAVILLPRITITKIVQGGAAQPSDFTFNASPAIAGHPNPITIPSGQSSVTIFDVQPNGNYTITENSVPGYGFVTGAGTSCSFNGSTATATVASGTAGNLVNASCTFTNGQLPGSITIVKNTSGGDGTFNFTGNVGVTSLTTVGGTASQTVNNLTAGSYNIAETVPTGWDLTSATCSDGSAISNIQLAAGENITCTFTNVKRGHLIVQKTTLPAGDSTVFNINAAGTGTITGGGAGTITDASDYNYEVTPGTYSVTETVPSGWSKTGDTCQNVVVNPGETKTCVITNTKLGSLTIIKNALPDSSQDFTFSIVGLLGGNFSLDDDADPTLSNQKVFTDLLPGQYSVTELSTPGWSLTGLSCNGNSTVQGATANVTLSAGQNITCTYTNTKLGSISGTKYIVNADGSITADQTAAMGWVINLMVNGNVVQTTQTDADGNYSFSDLLIGVPYSIAEVLTTGWTQITAGNTCANDSPITLAAGQNSGDNDFCNFQNGSISGHKWNDVNGDGDEDEGEARLNGWTITLHKDGNQVDSKVTAGNGDYSFTNLVPGTYSVCETQQTNWVQTYPANNTCHTIVINMSGETNEANFGNQGRGGIKVIKNVDTDGDGDIDEQDVDNWTWDINGSGNYATGSSNVQNVAAGSYTVSEDQKDNYHVTASSCSGENVPLMATTSLGVTVAPGETVTCTFTNTRDTGTITVNKVVNPSEGDDGLFNLQIDGQTAGTGANVGHGGTTGTITLPTGTHTVSEVAGTDTDLDDYISSYSCSNETSGAGTATGGFTLSTNENVTCTFTNVRKATLTVVKDAQPNDAQDFNFTLDKYVSLEDLVNLENGSAKEFVLDDDNDPTLSNTEVTSGLTPGAYIVHEDETTGWTLDNVTCGEGVEFEQEGSDILVWLAPGADVTCTFTNTRDTGTLTVVKKLTPSTDPGKFNLVINGETMASNVGDNGTTGSVTLPTGSYAASETAGTNTNLGDYESSYVCKNGDTIVLEGNGTTIAQIAVTKDQDVVCTFYNNKGQILGEEVTPLVNTGTNVLVTTIASILLISAVGAVTLATRRTTSGR